MTPSCNSANLFERIREEVFDKVQNRAAVYIGVKGEQWRHVEKRGGPVRQEWLSALIRKWRESGRTDKQIVDALVNHVPGTETRKVKRRRPTSRRRSS